MLTVGAAQPNRSVDPEPRVPLRGTAERTALVLVGATVAAQPLLHPTGPGNSSPVDGLTLLAITAVVVWAAGDRVRLRAPYAFPAGLMIVAGLLAALVSPFSGSSAFAVVQDVAVLSWAAVVATIAATPFGLRTLLAVWAVSSICFAAALVVASLAHVTFLTGVSARDGNRVPFTFGDPNYAALYWVMSLFVVYAAQVPRRRALRWSGYGVLLWAFALAESNGGLLEILVGLLVIGVAAVGRRFGRMPATVAALAAALAVVVVPQAVPMSSVRAWAVNTGQPFLVNSLGRSGDSAAQRSLLVHESLDLYKRSSVLGIGPSSTKPLLTRDGYPYAKEAHDDYLAALTERGPLGLLGLLWLTALVMWFGARFVRASKSPLFASAVPRPAGVVAALVAVGAAAFYYEVLHFRFVWALFAVLATVSGRARR